MPQKNSTGSFQVQIKLSKKKAHVVYRRKSDNKIVPGASTVSKVGEDTSFLQHWAWKMGVEGQDYRKVTEEAAHIGMVAHFLISCYLKGDDPDLSDFSANEIESGTKIFDKFKVSWSDSGLSLVFNEHELVSELGYGGTIDVIAKDKNNSLVLLDEKSSPRIYGHFIRQVAAYENLWNENNSEKISKRVIFRHGKTDPEDIEVVWLGDMSKHMDVFRKQLQLYYAFKSVH